MIRESEVQARPGPYLNIRINWACPPLTESQHQTDQCHRKYLNYTYECEARFTEGVAAFRVHSEAASKIGQAIIDLHKLGLCSSMARQSLMKLCAKTNPATPSSHQGVLNSLLSLSENGLVHFNMGCTIVGGVDELLHDRETFFQGFFIKIQALSRP